MSKTIRICWHPVKGGAIARAYVILVELVGKVRMNLAEAWIF